MPAPYFTPALFDFLRELRENNTREWFQGHRVRYEVDVRQPAMRFIAEFAPHLRKISPHFLADPRPVGGSMFRIYRDVRFSRDKSPYKTHVGIQFRHAAGKDAHAPAFYLHLEPHNVLVAAGVWRPDRKELAKIRDAIVEHADEWQKITHTPGFTENFSLSADRLKRPPRGYDPDHPLIEDLKLKSFTAHVQLSEPDVCTPDFMEHFARLCHSLAPLVRFLTQALEMPW